MLLGLGPRQRHGLGLGGHPLVLPLLAAARKRQVPDAEHDEAPKHNRDDDAARVEPVLRLHAHVLVLVVERAYPARQAVAARDRGGRARLRLDAPVGRLEHARRRGGQRGGEAVVAGLGACTTGCWCGGRLSGEQRSARDVVVVVVVVRGEDAL